MTFMGHGLLCICKSLWCALFLINDCCSIETFYKCYTLQNIYICMYSRSKKKEEKNIPIYFKTNYRTEMKLVPIIVEYCLLQFDALKFFLGVHLHEGSLPNFNFFNVNPQIFERNRKVYLYHHRLLSTSV